MTQDDRMETITDPAVIRACDEPDPFRRNPVAQTGPDDPWRFTRFVADDHECVIVRDEYDEPAPFGSCSTHRRALSSPVALGCTTSARVGAAMALDLDAVEAEFLRQCGGCDAGLMVGCTCSQRDFRPTMLALVAEVRRLTGVRAECERQFQAQVGLVAAETTRAEAAEAEVVTLRAKVAALQVAVSHSAESCADGPCEFHETVARAESAEAKVAAVQALAEKRDVLYPPKWAFGAEENYCNGYRQARADFIAAMATGEGQ